MRPAKTRLPRRRASAALSGPPEFNARAMEAEEAVICHGAALGLVPEVHEAGPEGTERVAPLHPQHRSGVGVTEVVQPVVVADRVSGDVVAGLVGCHVPAAFPDDDADLSLVVEVSAARRPHVLIPVPLSPPSMGRC